jgi:hypothetical protein
MITMPTLSMKLRECLEPREEIGEDAIRND